MLKKIKLKKLSLKTRIDFLYIPLSLKEVSRNETEDVNEAEFYLQYFTSNCK